MAHAELPPAMAALQDRGLSLEFRSTWPLPYLNALRQTILSEVPGPAFDTIEILEDTTQLGAAWIKHQFSMIPLAAALPATPSAEAGGTPPAVEAVLHAENPGEQSRLVTSSDLVVVHGAPESVLRDIPLLELAPGKRISLKLQSAIGTPRMHAKFQAAHAFHRILPTIQIPDLEALPLLRAACPRQVIDSDGRVQPERCTYCGQCERWATVTPSETLEFHIRANHTPARQVLCAALATLRERVRSLAQRVTAGSVAWQLDTDDKRGSYFIRSDDIRRIEGQLLVHELAAQPTVTFQSIIQPHPLQPTTVLRVKLDAAEADRCPVLELQTALERVVIRLTRWLWQAHAAVPNVS